MSWTESQEKRGMERLPELGIGTGKQATQGEVAGIRIPSVGTIPGWMAASLWGLDFFLR